MNGKWYKGNNAYYFVDNENYAYRVWENGNVMGMSEYDATNLIRGLCTEIPCSAFGASALKDLQRLLEQ